MVGGGSPCGRISSQTLGPSWCDKPAIPESAIPNNGLKLGPLCLVFPHSLGLNLILVIFYLVSSGYSFPPPSSPERG